MEHWNLRRTEDLIRAAIRDSYPIDWREEYLVRTLLRKIRDELQHLELDSVVFDAKVGWSIYQNHGRQEHMFGDIGVLVRLSFVDGKVVEGVGYLEAKKRTRNKDTFDELKLPQMRRIVKRAPRARLLLLDYRGIVGMLSDVEGSPWGEEYLSDVYGLQRAAVTYAVTVPINTAMALGARDVSLYPSCKPFSHQLLVNYLHGLDLEFDATSVNAAKGFADRLGAPRYLLVANVVRRGAPELPALKMNDNQIGPAHDI